MTSFVPSADDATCPLFVFTNAQWPPASAEIKVPLPDDATNCIPSAVEAMEVQLSFEVPFVIQLAPKLVEV